MKRNVLLYLSALTILFLLSGCSKDEEEDSYYGKIKDERVVFELNDVPAYVLESYMGYVFICYSEYADEYFTGVPDTSLEVFNDVYDHMIGVSLHDFETYNIPLSSKVYVSASVTNNCRIMPKELNPGIFYDRQVKAYLRDIRLRN